MTETTANPVGGREDIAGSKVYRVRKSGNAVMATVPKEWLSAEYVVEKISENEILLKKVEVVIRR